MPEVSMTESQISQPPVKKLPHEEECKQRIDKWDTELPAVFGSGDLGSLQLLKTAIEAQLALEELRIRARQADWAKITAWGPLLMPAIAALIGSLLGAWLNG